MKSRVNIKEEYEKIINEDENDNSHYKLKFISSTPPIMLAGIDPVNDYRQLYIDIGPEPWDESQLGLLPKWRGMTIGMEYFEKIGFLKERNLIIIRQEEVESTEIFEVVLQNIIDHIRSKDGEESLFLILYKVLDRWKHFFQKGGYKKLNDDQQKGLFGELSYIENWIERNPNLPPLVINDWDGPTSGRVDFKNSKSGIEIKTTQDKLTKSVKISNELQLKKTNDIENLYLNVFFVEKSKTHGTSLKDLVNRIRLKIERKSQRIALIFNDRLTDIGFNEDDYTEPYFYLDKEEVYKVNEDFPKLSQEMLPKGISHVKYNIDLTHCESFQSDKEEVYKLY
ncbi:PD-(D/E)XK motif protein [Halobacillus sp. Cin3]|uniref:PD-(D/E)XK motif protein n=1 Tax=Halobacillus sp. Cin3 TaxID=2928441 RepID=UPI00248E790F|nr:PD-(D/E)XK motif protein [Halobacillus sp. Cin3]